MKGGEHMTKEERLLRQEQRERAKAIEAAAVSYTHLEPTRRS